MSEGCRVGLSGTHFEWRDVEEALTRCRDEYGADMVEFSTDGRLLGENPAAVADLARRTGVGLSLHAWDNLTGVGTAQGVRMCRYWLDYGRTLGATHCVLHLGAHEDRAYGLRAAEEIVRTVAPEYAAAGLVLCLENHYPWEYRGGNELGGVPDEFAFLLDLDSPGVRFCLDTGHANMSCGTLPFIEALAPVLGYVHVTDNRGEHDEHLPYLAGTVDWSATLDALQRREFRGPYVIEYAEARGIEHQLRFISDLRARFAAEAPPGGAQP
jgi:sugar phosphate isomerase/epimerase